jgi:hypothetical protein
MPLTLGPFKINLADKLRSGFRVKYNLLVDKVIEDGQAIPTGFKVITHDNSEIEVDLTEYFYNKETIDEMFFIEYATEEEAGKIRIATIEEVLEGEDDLTVVTPYKLWLYMAYQNGRPITAGEDLEYGDMICIVPTFEYEDPEDLDSPRTLISLVAMKALATAKATLCDGFVEEGGLEGEDVFIKLSGAVNQGQVGLYPHKWYYLSAEDPGKIVSKKPTEPGTFAQPIGYAISEEEIMVELADAVQVWEPIFEELPALIFVVGIESTQEVYLADYVTEWNADKLFTYVFKDLPEWISEHIIVFDNMALSGLAPEEGEFTSYLEVTDEEGNVGLQEFKILAIPATIVKVGLIDVEADEVVGQLPGGHQKPDLWKLGIEIIGPHDRIDIEVNGGGPAGESLSSQYSEAVEYTEEGNYIFNQDNAGFDSEAGVYMLQITTFIGDRIQSVDYILFVLYDDEYLSKVRYELWDRNAEVKLGDINPDGSSTFKYVKSWDVKVIVVDILHDYAGLNLGNNDTGSSIVRILYPDPPVEEAEYFVYDAAGTVQNPGHMSMSTSYKLADALVFIGLVDFEVLEEEVKATGGLKLINMLPNTVDHVVVNDLALAGGQYDKPDSWSVLSEYEGPEIDYVSWVHYLKSEGGYAIFNSTPYTGQPQSISYKEPVTEASIRSFWDKGSADIAAIDEVPSEHRIAFTYRNGGANGEVVLIQQSDFALREPLLPGEGTGLRFFYLKDGEPDVIDTNMPSFNRKYILRPDEPWSVSILSFDGLSFDKVKVQVHKKIAEVFNLLHLHTPDAVQVYTGPLTTELTSDLLACVVGDGDPRTLLNTLGADIVIDEIGEYRVTMTGYNGIVPLEARISEFELIDEPEEIPIKDCCLGDISGTPGAIPKFSESGESLEDSVMQEIDGEIWTEGRVRSTVATGLSPFTVSSITKVANLNVDLLDDQNGLWYLDRTNHTGTQLAATISDFSAATRLVTLTGLSIVTGSPITAADTVLSAFGKLQGQVNTIGSSVSGTAGYIPQFLTSSTLGNSLMSISGINVIANGGQYVSYTAHNVNPRGFAIHDVGGLARWSMGKSALESGANSGSDFTINRFNDAGGFLGAALSISRATGLITIEAPLTITGSGIVIITTSTTLNTNFNADLLDGEHGAFYLNRTNHTGTQLAATISDFSAAVRLVTLTGLSIVTGSAITAADTILSAFGKLQGQINTVTGAIGTGTAGYLPVYATASTFSNSIVNQVGINVTANAGQFAAATAPNVNPRGLVLQTDTLSTRWTLGKSGLESGANSGSDYTLARYSDAGTFINFALTISRATGLMTLPGTLTIGGAGVVISTTSTALNTNFNADLLDNEHGAFYLDRANHTGFQAISTVTGLQTELDAKVVNFGNGVANRFALWINGTTIANSNLYYNAGNVGVGMSPGYQFDVAGAIRCTTQFASTLATGTAPIDVTSTTLCVNLNADLLDGQHGAYYRDRANHTGVQAISTITGLQTALDGKLSGAGTAGRIVKYLTSTTVGDSVMSESGTDITVAGQLFSDVAHNTNVRGFGYRALGLNRWNVGKAGTESGGNSGSDYVGWAYDDAGAFLRETFRFSRATGALTLASSVSVPGGNSTNWNTAFGWGNHAGLYAPVVHTHTIAQVTALQASLDSKVINFGNGVANRFALWVDGTQIGNSNLYYNAGNVGVGMSPGYQFDVAGAIRCTTQFASTLATGTKPIDVASTTMCNNLNADLLDGLHASDFALVSHTHVAANITDFTSAARGTISGTGSISYNSSTGVISYTGAAGLTGTGSNTYFAMWTGTSSMSYSVIRDTGSEINVGSGRSFGVEGPAAMRDYLHVWGYASFGTATNHGTLVLHNLSSATIDGSAAFEIRSTTKGLLLPRMTQAQRRAISSPATGLMVLQTDTGEGGGGPYYCLAGVWAKLALDYVDV